MMVVVPPQQLHQWLPQQQHHVYLGVMTLQRVTMMCQQHVMMVHV